MFTTILVLMVIVAILLIVLVLIQNPKGGGLSSEFGGGGTQMFGVQRTSDIVEKLTWGFFAFIVVGALASGIFFKTNENAKTDDQLNVETNQAAPTAPTQTIPPPPTTPQPATPAPTK